MEIDETKQSVIDEQEKTIQEKQKVLQDVALAAGKASQEASDLKDALHEQRCAVDFKESEICRLQEMMHHMERQMKEQNAMMQRM
eukprot:3289326-Karenia_brevis.AAC.1